MKIQIVRAADGSAVVWVDVGNMDGRIDKEIVVEAARELQREIIRYEAKERGIYGRNLNNPFSRDR